MFHNTQNPLHTFPSNFPVILLATSCVMYLKNDTTPQIQRTFARPNLLQTCYGLVVYVADLLRTCYGETGVMDFDLITLFALHVKIDSVADTKVREPGDGRGKNKGGKRRLRPVYYERVAGAIAREFSS